MEGSDTYRIWLCCRRLFRLCGCVGRCTARSSVKLVGEKRGDWGRRRLMKGIYLDLVLLAHLCFLMLVSRIRCFMVVVSEINRQLF